MKFSFVLGLILMCGCLGASAQQIQPTTTTDVLLVADVKNGRIVRLKDSNFDGRADHQIEVIAVVEFVRRLQLIDGAIFYLSDFGSDTTLGRITFDRGQLERRYAAISSEDFLAHSLIEVGLPRFFGGELINYQLAKGDKQVRESELNRNPFLSEHIIQFADDGRGRVYMLTADGDIKFVRRGPDGLLDLNSLVTFRFSFPGPHEIWAIAPAGNDLLFLSPRGQGPSSIARVFRLYNAATGWPTLLDQLIIRDGILVTIGSTMASGNGSLWLVNRNAVNEGHGSPPPSEIWQLVLTGGREVTRITQFLTSADYRGDFTDIEYVFP